MVSDSFIRDRLERHWQILVFSMLQEAAFPDELDFTLDDLLKCEKINPLASHAIDVIGKNKFNWTNYFTIGLKHYFRLQRLIEVSCNPAQ